jgi:hypothetical protein
MIIQKLHNYIPPARKFLESEEAGRMTQIGTMLVKNQAVDPHKLDKKNLKTPIHQVSATP